MKQLRALVALAALLISGAAGASVLNTSPVADGVTATQLLSVDPSNTAPTGSELPAAVQQTILTKTLQSSAVANGNGTAFPINGYSSAVLTVNCASCSGGTTVSFQGSEDAANWTSLQALQLGTSTLATNTTTAGVTVWQLSTAGLQQIRAVVSGYSAGTVTVTAHAAQTTAAYQILLVSPTGQPTSGSTSSGQSLNNMACWTVTALPTTNTNGQTYPCYAYAATGAIGVDLSSIQGVALGAMANYGTSPGAVKVPGVNAFVTNVVGTQAPVNNTATDCSVTLTTGGTAQNAFTAQTTLHGFTIANIDATSGGGEPVWFSFTGTAVAGAAGSYPLSAPTATTFANLTSFTTPTGFALNHALSVIAATTSHKISCTWW